MSTTIPRSLGDKLAYNPAPSYGVEDPSESELANSTGEHLSYGDFGNEWRGNSDARWYIPDLLSGSDYSGGSVTVANMRSFLEMFGARKGVHTLYGNYGSYGVVIHDATIDADMLEVFEGLDNYPCIADEAVFMVELEAEEEAWESWVASDFRSELYKLYPEDRHDQIFDMDNDALYSIFHNAAERDNVYWENETGNQATIDIKRIARAAILPE